MTQRVVKNADDLALLKVYLDQRKRPFTVDITDGRNRSEEQNRLSHKWYKEISEQTGEAVEDVRARCKLELGVPILRAGSEAFCKTYDRLIRPLDYEKKIEMMMIPIDVAVTRIMTTKQKASYLDAIHTQFTSVGIELTDPMGWR